MRVGNIFILCLIAGAIWGAIYTVLVTLLALLITGAEFQPQLWQGTAAGLLAAGALTIQPPGKRDRQALITAGGVFVAALVLLTLFRPLGLGLGQVTLGQIIFLALMAFLLVWTIDLTAKDLGPGHERRYNVEVVILRFFKGFGLVFFTIAVALPFFVMVMMSLKNQQLLLSDPLDFSLDLSQGLAALFRSYIELFGQ